MVAQVQVRVVFNRLPELQRRVPNVVDDAVQAVAREGERIVKDSMKNSPQSGRQYGAHIASSPGNPPRPDSSSLMNSITAFPVRSQYWKIATSMEYAAMLEFGTQKTAARPFMGPMADQLGEDAGEIVERYLKALMG